MDSKALRSPLAKARNHGSAKSGTGHWWWQRITAIIMVPLFIWVVYALLTHVVGRERADIADWFASPWVTVAWLVLLSAVFYHAKLGMQVVIEDYVHCPVKKYTLLIGSLIAFLALTVISWMAILKLHIIGI